MDAGVIGEVGRGLEAATGDDAVFWRFGCFDARDCRLVGEVAPRPRRPRFQPILFSISWHGRAPQTSPPRVQRQVEAAW